MSLDLHDHDRGLQFDLSTLNRRSLLGVAGAAGLIALAGCGTEATNTAAPATTDGASASASASAAAAGECTTEIPEETAGPFPGDGSNGPDVLTQSGVVRQDIRSSFGSASGVAEGIPLTVTLTVQDLSKGCSAYSGAAVYLWHCDRDGNYSMYAAAVANENYLRGVQEADASGQVTFETIFPAAYSGRWPHIHFEVYPSLSSATAASNKITTSQLALPQDASDEVYATAGYEASVSNMAQTSLSTDMVFSDGVGQQMAAVTGNTSEGYTATLTVPV
jgi:protocatechuate 3,4-dioxygenase beta subunit